MAKPISSEDSWRRIRLRRLLGNGPTNLHQRRRSDTTQRALARICPTASKREGVTIGRSESRTRFASKIRFGEGFTMRRRFALGLVVIAAMLAACGGATNTN